MDGNLDPALDREREIFLAALERPSPGDRAAFLDGACGKDAPLRARLESLLRHHSEDGFLEGTVADLKGVPRSEASVGEDIGGVIGRYKLLEKIGEGGMGVVYMAQQEEPVRRRVALKIIKLGMDTKQVVARFEAERQALALMDHPNIAKVLDGGATDTGRPYFVMELVRGVPITEFCDRNRFPARERIKLFITVCQAIQSAHQKGIIHRDLKPGNILVTLDAGVPMPMVIDFGVAKATQQKLTEKTVFTNYATMIGTPAYMSPEQAEMSRLDVDTRSDIYGLGVLLYELLTGTTPFPEQRLRSASYQEMQRIILEEEPERPSTRLSTLQGEQRSLVARNRGASELALGRVFADDLDWIVMKCLEKDRARRYETANGLAADLKRHLSNEPVVARPPSTAYRLQKAWRRNKVTFTAGAVVAGALVVGIGVSSWQAIEASKARNAEQEQRLAAQTERDRARAAQKEAERAKEAETSTPLKAEQQLYAARMNVAQVAWDQNNIGQLRQLLKDTQDSPNRSFEVVLLAEANSLGREDAPRPSALSELGDLFPGRPARCHWQLGSDGQGVGRGQRQGIAYAEWAQGWDCLYGLLSGRPADRQRQCGSDGQGVGCGQWHESAHAQGAQRSGCFCGLLPGRPADCHRQLGSHGQGVGGRQRAPTAHARGAHQRG